MKLSDAADTKGGRDAIQENLEKLEKSTHEHLMKLSARCCSWVEAISGMRLGEEFPERSPVEKDLGVLMHENLDMIKQCVLAVQKAKLILGCITNSVAGRSSKVILLLCSALLRTHLDHRIQLWVPQHKEDVDLLE